MKRLIFLISLMLISITTYADELSDARNQFGKTLVAVIAKETNGYVTEETANEYVYSAFIQVPEFYDNHLIIQTINPIVDTAELTLLKPWTAIEDGVLSAYKFGSASNVNFRFDVTRHFLMLAVFPIKE